MSEAIHIPGPHDPPVSVLHVNAAGAEGWLVIDTVHDGLSFGGFRFSAAVTEHEVCLLARTMTLKLAAHGLPTGGAKAGLRCDPSSERMPEILAAFAAACRDLLSHTVILGKDLGATDALLDGLYSALGFPQLQVVVERSAAGNCPGRVRELAGYVPHMTGRGAAWACRAALGSLEGRRIAIQGAGAVGLGTAIRTTELGAKVVAISDAQKTVVAASSDGLPVHAVLRASAADRTIDPVRCDFPWRQLPRDALFAQDADVVVLAASSNSVDEKLARTIEAPFVVEASNFGLTEQARVALHARGRCTIPDVIASSSSAALVTHQVATGNRWASQPLWDRIRRAIERSVELGVDDFRRKGIAVREAHLDRIRDPSALDALLMSTMGDR